MWRLLLVLLVSCGGKIEGGPLSDGGGSANDSSDPISGGGGLRSGPCPFTPGFMPNGQPATTNPEVKGVGTAASSGSTFALTCTGTAADTFYYATEIDGIAAMMGTQKVMGSLKQTTNGREGETAMGGCTVTVTSISADKKATGSFDCSLFDDPIGTFLIKGTFSAVPL